MKSMIMVISICFSKLAAGADGYPDVHLLYSFVPFDYSCSELSGSEIDPAWIEELDNRLPEFQKAWDEAGPALMKTLISETGKPFLQKEMRATLTLCRFRSMSLPLLLNVRAYMQANNDKPPRPLFMFVGLVFHELLHNYLMDHRTGSKLLEKYQNEPRSVLSHLHLCAALKMTYLKLGLERELADIVARDVSLGPIYRRAWEIVNDIEGYRAFVDELK